MPTGRACSKLAPKASGLFSVACRCIKEWVLALPAMFVYERSRVSLIPYCGHPIRTTINVIEQQPFTEPGNSLI
jgi:hypothetical protein